MSPSSKFGMRRGRHGTPRSCVPPPPPPIIPVPPPPNECFFSPDELFVIPASNTAIDLYACCPVCGANQGTAIYTCTGGSWDNESLQVDNCGALTENSWNSPEQEGDFTLTAKITWPGGHKCTATAIAHVAAEDP